MGVKNHSFRNVIQKISVSDKMKMRYGICALLLFIMFAAIYILLLFTQTKKPVKKYPGKFVSLILLLKFLRNNFSYT